MTPLPLVVAVHEKGMKDAWFLASSCYSLDAAANVALYGKRFKIEETFRDIKDAHFGVGMTFATIKSPDRRDRLLVAAAIAQVFLTLLGKAGESIGLDRKVKANTTTKRKR